ncbi:hypothetical protein MM59RIKEN_12230 [Pusillibacter faecalis]|uniref:Uncharacterized protein n=1 Tax=Pusillibacter faecalis TaxID=2714358 RepID=A0A810Q7F9_9FIRM|nr:hypothetical protein MM59RIKEN_12230 [Pusillibacter faecalis]
MSRHGNIPPYDFKYEFLPVYHISQKEATKQAQQNRAAEGSKGCNSHKKDVKTGTHFLKKRRS